MQAGSGPGWPAAHQTFGEDVRWSRGESAGFADDADDGDDFATRPDYTLLPSVELLN